MERVLAALAEQHAELDGLIAPLDPPGWAKPSRCEGWTIADVVLHLAQTDELSTASARGEPATVPGYAPGGHLSVDDAVSRLVATERGETGPAVRERWLSAAAAQRDAFAACAPDRRLNWLGSELAAQTLATTRLSEAWIHTYDIAWGLDVVIPPTERLWHVARLAWRTLPYAFSRAGALAPAVAVRLIAPDGSTWQFGDGPSVTTTVEGPAEEFCLIAARRLDPDESAVRATGPDAREVLQLIRTYAQ